MLKQAGYWKVLREHVGVSLFLSLNKFKVVSELLAALKLVRKLYTKDVINNKVLLYSTVNYI